MRRTCLTPNELDHFLSAGVSVVTRDLHSVKDSNDIRAVMAVAERALAMLQGAATQYKRIRANADDGSPLSVRKPSSESQERTQSLVPLNEVVDVLALPRFESMQDKLGTSSSAILSHTAELTVDAAGFDAVNQYTVMHPLGSGTHGKVYLAFDNVRMEERAIKAVRRHRASPAVDPRREVAVMKKLNHPNIVKLYECIDDPGMDVVYLVMQYVSGGPLLRFDSEYRCPAFSTARIRPLMQQLASALSCMHARGVVHFDIKPDNLLVDAQGHLYLADFGVSSLASSSNDLPFMKHFRGTPLFAPPEALDGDTSSVGAPGDMWAVGVTLYAMVYGCLPFTAESVMSLVNNVLHGALRFPASTAEQLKWGELICRLLERKQSRRLTAFELCHHPMLAEKGTLNDSDSSVSETLLSALTEDEINDAFSMSLKINSAPKKKEVA